MGPIQLRIDEGNLYQAWEKSRRSEIDGYKGDRKGQIKVLETWICRPPNVMMFQLNRVNYDYQKQKLIKDNSKFHFDKTIYLDEFLNQNRLRAKKYRKELDQLKSQLKNLIQTHDDYVAQSQLIEKFKECEKIVRKTCDHDKNYK